MSVLRSDVEQRYGAVFACSDDVSTSSDELAYNLSLADVRSDIERS